MGIFKSGVHDFSKLDYDLILLTHIQDCGRVLSKIDTSFDNPDFSHPQGVSHSDIVRSYSDMVEHLESLLEPEHDEEYLEWLNANLWESSNEAERLFRYAKTKFGKLMLLCNRQGFLFKKIKSAAAAEGEDDDGLGAILEKSNGEAEPE